jgi:thioredoxin reductase
MSAALEAADAGCRVVLIDAGTRLGGQYYRQLPEAFHAERPGALHHDFATAEKLFAQLEAHPEITVLGSTTVWHAGSDGGTFTFQLVHAGTGRAAGQVTSDAVVLATGAFDLALPFPGWDLPGVVTAGGAQALAKGQRIAVGQRVLVSGTGPFLMPVAVSLAEAGAKVVGVLDANHPAAWRKHLGTVWRHRNKLAEGVDYARALRRHRIPVRFRRAVVAAQGTDRVEQVTVARLRPDWSIARGSQRQEDVDAVCVGYGFVPSLELPLALGCATRPGAHGIPVVAADANLATSVPGVYVAGEATGVAGSAQALLEGRLAGLALATRTGHLSPAAAGERLAAYRQERAKAQAFADAMHGVYPVADGWRTWLKPQTLVCRCEEVTYGKLTTAVEELGVTDARSAKLIARPGMGLCQGRICGTAVASLLGARPPGGDPTSLAKRPIAVPVRLDVLAGPTEPSNMLLSRQVPPHASEAEE